MTFKTFFEGVFNPGLIASHLNSFCEWLTFQNNKKKTKSVKILLSRIFPNFDSDFASKTLTLTMNPFSISVGIDSTSNNFNFFYTSGNDFSSIWQQISAVMNQQNQFGFSPEVMNFVQLQLNSILNGKKRFFLNLVATTREMNCVFWNRFIFNGKSIWTIPNIWTTVRPFSSHLWAKSKIFSEKKIIDQQVFQNIGTTTHQEKLHRAASRSIEEVKVERHSKEISRWFA